MRRLLVTGPGGAGRTTVAAAAACAAAAAGQRTLLLTVDAERVLETAVPGTPEAPTAVADGLWAARLDAAGDFRTEFLDLQRRVSAGLDLLGSVPFDAEELTELPGSEQFALLRALTAASRGDWDLLVVDMPPLRETLALLALPGELRRYLRRLLPPERQAARALRPVLAQLAGVPMPARWLYATAERWDTELAGVQAVVESSGTALALVAEPGPGAADALRAAGTGLALHGHRVAAVVANRMVPAHSPDPWVASLAAQQRKCVEEWRDAWEPAVPVREAAHLGRDPRGRDDLLPPDGFLGGSLPAGGFPGDGGPSGHGVPGDGVPGADGREETRRPDPWTVRRAEPGDAAAGDGTLLFALPLPGAVKEDLTLVRRGDELLLTVGPFRRIVPLPSVLRRCTVSGAALRDGTLTVRFTPDPDLWPRSR
ncbi:ArsA-related P-loop ATPase [Streptomyces sp. NPDC005805]|uniref:ArsA family ATPase n=1 Tax=Streptomyces sp. NPDC005805 TaxID=3157068 RepID=UPI0033E36D31